MADMEVKDVLFEIRQENLETGMRGYPVGYCTTSSVDPQRGLSYREIPVSEMGEKDPYDVIFLLYEGHSGSAEELQAFKKKIQERMSLKEETKQAIRNLPVEGHPMKLFSAALLILGMLEGSSDWKEDLYRIVAKIPLVGAEVINHHAGWGGTRKSDPSLGYMENFTHIVNVPQAEQRQLAEAFRLFNILHYDHGGGNLSTFIGKAIASGLEDMYGSLTGACCALAGPRHGKANQDCLAFV
jgi:citrate synthase